MTELSGIPGFAIGRLLGRGGMGVVYVARQPRNNRSVALKVARPLEGCTRNHLASLVHEAQVLALLKHPNVVKMYDFGCNKEELAWIAMELIEGHSLRHLMRAHRITQTLAVVLFRQLCEALQHVHACGVTHQDLKPENILIDHDNQAKIVDFGLAKVRGLSYTIARPGRVSGTLRYMAPEQRLHPRDIDHRIDIYALGVIMFEMLTGQRPADASPLPPRIESVSPEIDAIVQRCLQRNPNERWQSAAEMLAALGSTDIPEAPPCQPWSITDTAIDATLQEAGSSTSLFT